jgi:hypothetical protein
LGAATAIWKARDLVVSTPMAKSGAPPACLELTANRAASLREAVDLLMVTATDVERDAVLARLRPLRAHKTVLQGASTYHLGAVGSPVTASE